MRRAILVFLLTASICFQGVALAKQVLARDRGGDAAHSMVHADGVAHHHREDGSVHKDTSTKFVRGSLERLTPVLMTALVAARSR